MTDLLSCDLDQFLGRFASPEPAPGGGSASALAGAVAASLVCMIARLTLKKPPSDEAAEELLEIVQRASLLKDRLTTLVHEDAESYLRFFEARGLPKETDEQKAGRKSAVAQAATHMTMVPLTTMRSAFELVDMLQRMLVLGNPNAVSDLGVAATLARSAIQGAYMNVAINLPQLQGDEKQRCADDAKLLLETSEKTIPELLEKVQSKIS